MEEKNKKKEEISTTEQAKISKKIKSKENQILFWILLSIGIIILLVLAGYFYVTSQINFDYKGVKFKAIKEGNIIFYKTTIGYIKGEYMLPYNIFIRTKPSLLKEIPFKNASSFKLKSIAIFNSQKGIDCDGDFTIATANLAQVNFAMGIKYGKNENLTCDPKGRYNYFKLKLSNASQIIQTAPNCYELDLRNECDVLKVTEKLIAEMIYQYNKRVEPPKEP